MAADNVCNVSEYEDPFADFENFTNTAPIIAAHNRVPRFGHSNDILDLISGSRNEQKDYLTGVFAFSILVCCIFLAWSFLLCLWKGMGSKRVGFLSGQRQALPPRPGGTTTTTTTTGQQKVLLFHDDDDDNGETTTTAAAAAVAQPSAAAAPTYGHSYDENPILSLPDDVPPSMDPAHGNSSTANTNAAVSPTGDDDNGIYAGTKPSASQVPAITTQTPEQWDVMYQKKLCQQKWMKATVAIACAVVVAMAVLMGVLGVGSLTGSMDDSQTSLYNAQQLIGVGVGYVDDLVTTLTTFQSDLQSLLGDANKLCPTLYPDGICTNISDPSTCNSNGVILNTSAMDQLITWVDSDWAVIGRLDETSDNLLEISNSAADASNKLNKIDWVFWTAVGFDMIVGILALCMLVGLFLPKMLSGIVGCIKHWCLLPFFLICTALAFIFAVAFLITSLMIADTCVDNPNERIVNITEYWMQEKQIVVSQTVKFWLNQCNAQPPSIDEYDEYLAEAQSVVQGFEQALSDAAVVLAGECNVTNTSSVEANVSTLFASVCSSVLLLRNIRNAFSCQTWLPLYYTAVYDALCYNGTNGVWAIAATQFVVVVMACLIMTFRAVFWDLKIMDDRPKDDDEEDDDSGNHEKGGEQPQERSIEAPPPPVAGVAVEEDASPEADRDAGVVPPQGLSTVEVY